ncbi:MAG TPA: GntR family transcriptional regulator [Actinopolymorphaceae bacterium]|jgi:DNA-binding GntR family transcriptional regulator
MLENVRKSGDGPPSLQVYRTIAAAIASGTFPPGSRLPSERELSSSLAVSRATLRVALRALYDDGLLEPTHGSGWHVIAPPSVVEEGQEPPLSFTEMAASRGLRASAEVLHQGTRPSTLDEAEVLGIAPGSELFCLDRLRKLDDMPVALASACLPAAAVAAAIHLDYRTRSLYATLREACGIRPARADYVLSARGATAEEARRLDMAEGAAVLVGKYTCFDDQDRPFELGHIIYRGDRYRFRTVLRDRRAVHRPHT